MSRWLLGLFDVVGSVVVFYVAVQVVDEWIAYFKRDTRTNWHHVFRGPGCE